MKRASIFSLVLLLIICGCGGGKSHRYAPGTVVPDEEGISEFTKSFFKEEKISEMVDAMDVLTDVAHKSIYQGNREMMKEISEGGSLPAMITSPGLQLVLSVTSERGNYYYHFSFSAPAYIATTISKTITGALCLRTGLAVPGKISVSNRGVNHVEWTLNNSEHQALISGIEPKESLPGNIKLFMAEAIFKEQDIEIEYQ